MNVTSQSLEDGQARLLVIQHRKNVIRPMVISQTQKVVLLVLMQWLEMI